MANRSLSLENALEIFKIIESIEDYSYKEEELYKFDLLQEYDFNFVSNKIHKPFKYIYRVDIFNLNGSLRKKYKYSFLEGYDIIDVINSLRLNLAHLHWIHNNSSIDDIIINIHDEIIFKVLNNFIPDDIQYFIEQIDGLNDDLDAYNSFFATATYIFGGWEGDELTTGYDYSFFNNLSFHEKKVMIYSTCYRSKQFREWEYLYKEYIFEVDEGLEEFKHYLSTIELLSYEKYMKNVRKKLRLID